MSERSETQFESLDYLLSGFADESIFRLRLLAPVLYLHVHLPAYIIRQIQKRPRPLLQIVEIKFRCSFVD